MTDNYSRIVDKISKVSELDKEEVIRKIEAKRAKLSDLISYEGAAQIVAAELNISFEDEKLKINELLPGMRKANTSGKVISEPIIRNYKTSKGDDSKVANFFIADDTSNVRVVLWDTNHIDLFEKNEFGKDSVVELVNASVRDNELHLGSFSEIKKSVENFSNLVTEKIVKEKNISDFSISDNVKSRAFVVQSFPPKFFYVCPQCNKKANTDGENYVCVEHGKVVPEKRALINIVIDDGTENIRSVLFHENIKSLGLNDLEDAEKLNNQRDDLLGKEFYFGGNVRKNTYFNQPEFVIDSVEEVNVDNLVAELEK